MPRTTAGALLIIGGFLTIGLAIAPTQIHLNEVGLGNYWLALNPNERATYVAGFIDGYLGGTNQLCKSADQLFKVRDPKRVSSNVIPGFEASAVCLASRSDYSREYSSSGLDFSHYVNAITEFYTKYPDYRAVSVAGLMLSLADGKSENCDQLYQHALKGDLLRVPSR